MGTDLLMTVPRWTGVDTGTVDARSTLLLIHGFPFDHRIWREQYQRLPEQNVRVIAPDLPGFGDSEPIPDADCVTMDDYAVALIRLLDHLHGIAPVTVAGISMGGYIAMAMLERFPQRIDRLILCDTRSEADTPEVAASRLLVAKRALDEPNADFLADSMIPKLLSETTRKNRPQLETLVRSTMSAASPAGIAAAARGMALRPDRSHLLRKISIPVDFVVGVRDVFSPPEVMERMWKLVPESVASRLIRVPDAAHLAPLENPDAFPL
ncbi:MAG: alpha/beta hydrolase [Planctomycetia bacterium]|nr:alpha/beta hydrolase [Planctomycetia bacterium]